MLPLKFNDVLDGVIGNRQPQRLDYVTVVRKTLSFLSGYSPEMITSLLNSPELSLMDISTDQVDESKGRNL